MKRLISLLSALGSLVCVLLATGNWVGAAVLAEAKVSMPFAVLLSALGWLFLTIAIGGEKGFAVGVGIMVFAGCAAILFWGLAKVSLNSHLLGYNLGSENIFFWFGIVAGVCLTLIIPAKVTVKLWKKFT